MGEPIPTGYDARRWGGEEGEDHHLRASVAEGEQWWDIELKIQVAHHGTNVDDAPSLAALLNRTYNTVLVASDRCGGLQYRVLRDGKISQQEAEIFSPPQPGNS
jgi:hypothetical protein